MNQTAAPKPRDAHRTRKKLLAAAVRLFSAKGYDGVAVEEIVRAAGCSKRMLYHYFGNKEGLYAAALRQAFEAVTAQESALLEKQTTALAAVNRILENSFRFLQAHPEFISLVLQENLRGGRTLDRHPGLLSKSPILSQLDAILEDAASRGEIQESPGASHLLTLLYSLAFFPFSNRHTLRHTLGLDTRCSETRARHLQLAKNFVLRALLANPKPPAPSASAIP